MKISSPSNRGNRGRLPEKFADFLSEQIENDKIARGDRLPPEAVLAKQMGVGRTVIRQALAGLRRSKGDLAGWNS